MLLASMLRQMIKKGRLTLIDAAGKNHVFGPGPDASLGLVPVTIRVLDRATQRRLALNPKLAFGEAYMDGKLTIEDGTLYQVLDVLAVNVEVFEHTALGRVSGFFSRLMRRVHQYNPASRARRNVAHHYDLSGALYDLFLDNDRQYSCAYWPKRVKNLEDAQTAKKRHLASKLLLEPGQKVLDIGSGWGGLGLYLADIADVDVTGITLSTEQHQLSNARASESGLKNRVRFELRDYRDAQGPFDRIVSVGMFEHVGSAHYVTFFRKLRDLLSEDGVAVLHSIGRMSKPGSTNAWLRKYIFPGGYSPALSETLAAIEKAGLWVTDIEVLRLHYAETLRQWHDRFQKNRDAIKEIYDERFCRMWEFYLIGCELSFRRIDQMVFQIQLSRRQDAVPLTRDYMVDWERDQLERDNTTANSKKSATPKAREKDQAEAAE